MDEGVQSQGQRYGPWAHRLDHRYWRGEAGSARAPSTGLRASRAGSTCFEPLVGGLRMPRVLPHQTHPGARSWANSISSKYF